MAALKALCRKSFVRKAKQGEQVVTKRSTECHNTVIIILSGLLSLGCITEFVRASEPWRMAATDRLVSMYSQSSRGVEGVYRYQAFSATPLRGSLENLECETGEFIRSVTGHLACADGRFLRRQAGDSNVSAIGIDDDWSAAPTEYWDGNMFWTLSDDERLAVISGAPDIDIEWGLAAYVLGIDGPSTICPAGAMSTYLNAPDVVSETVGDTEVRLTIASDNSLVVLEFDKSMLPYPKRAYRIERNLVTGEVVFGIDVHVVEWMTIEGEIVPRRAIRTGMFGEDPKVDSITKDGQFVEGALAQVSIIEVVERRAIDEIAAPVRAESLIGWTIVDPRLKVSTEVGSFVRVHHGVAQQTTGLIDSVDELLSMSAQESGLVLPTYSSKYGDNGLFRNKVVILAIGVVAILSVVAVFAGRKSNTRRLGLVIGCVSVCLAGVVVVTAFRDWRNASLAEGVEVLEVALTGAIEHPRAVDFGRFKWTGAECEREATVKIRNASTASVEIAAVKSTCGCTKANVKDRILAPGESTQMEITLKFNAPGESHQAVQFAMMDGPVCTIDVVGTAVTEVYSNILESAVDLRSKGEAIVHVYQATPDMTEPPPAPTMVFPDGGSATFLGWSKWHHADPERGLEFGRWVGQIRLEAKRPMGHDDSIAIRLSDQLLGSVNLGNWPW